MRKKCCFCGSSEVINKGFESGVQRWCCKVCKRRFFDRRKTPPSEIRRLYQSGKFGTADLAALLGISRSTICRALRRLEMPSGFDAPKSIVALMDTTYWGRKFGVVTIKDHLSGHVLWRKFIDRKERIEDYVEGISGPFHDEDGQGVVHRSSGRMGSEVERLPR